MKKLTVKILKYLHKIINYRREYFEEDGERVFIDFHKMEYSKLDMYQKSHLKRYQFATTKVKPFDNLGDFACGTGYGTVLLASFTRSVVGVDINSKIVTAISKKYINIANVSFLNSNLLDLSFKNKFEKIISFETIEHLEEESIIPLFKIFNDALKDDGLLIFSVPYMQEPCKAALELGHHKTFSIDITKATLWLDSTNFKLQEVYYQNYLTHEVLITQNKKDFLICVAQKIKT